MFWTQQWKSFMTYFCTTGLEGNIALPRVFMTLRQGTFYQLRRIPIRYHSPWGRKWRQLDEMIQRGVITPSCSEWAAPVILVRKKSVDGVPKYRFCTDFRGLNAVNKIPVYPNPDIKSNLSLMAGSCYFTLLDIESSYWHIPFHPHDKDKTGFITPVVSRRKTCDFYQFCSVKL